MPGAAGSMCRTGAGGGDFLSFFSRGSLFTETDSRRIHGAESNAGCRVLVPVEERGAAHALTRRAPSGERARKFHSSSRSLGQPQALAILQQQQHQRQQPNTIVSSASQACCWNSVDRHSPCSVLLCQAQAKGAHTFEKNSTQLLRDDPCSHRQLGAPEPHRASPIGRER